MPARLADLAVRFGCELRGDPDTVVDRVAPLQDAGPGAVSFLANPQYRRYLPHDPRHRGRARCRDRRAVPGRGAGHRAIHTRPTRASRSFCTRSRAVVGGRHPSAVVEPGAEIDPTAWIGPQRLRRQRRANRPARQRRAGLGAARRRAGRRRHAARRPGHAVRVARASARAASLQPGCVIGGDGFGHAPDKDGYVKVPQVGAVRDRQRRRGRQQFHDRPRRDRRHGDRGRRQDRQPRADRPQRARRRPHGDRRVRRDLRQHDDRQALHARRHGGRRGPPRRSATTWR